MSITEEQHLLLKRVEEATSSLGPYFTEEDEADDMAALFALGLVEGDITEVEINEFGMLELYTPRATE